MTSGIQTQYDAFLKRHNGHLQASKIYNLNPIAVDTSPNIQTINISGANLTLGNLKID